MCGLIKNNKFSKEIIELIIGLRCCKVKRRFINNYIKYYISYRVHRSNIVEQLAKQLSSVNIKFCCEFTINTKANDKVSAQLVGVVASSSPTPHRVEEMKKVFTRVCRLARKTTSRAPLPRSCSTILYGFRRPHSIALPPTHYWGSAIPVRAIHPSVVLDGQTLGN